MRRALVVNAYFPESRRPAFASRTVLRAMGPPFLAGWLAPDQWTIRLHDENTAAPIRTPEDTGGPDLLVLTGLTPALDRMLHLAALAKTANPRCVTVAGGPAVRAAPAFAAERFDYACLGDVEELATVVADAFGPAAPAREWTPRFDLARWCRGAVYAESSRYCNFRCTFCSLTGEGRPFERYPLASLEKQIELQPPRRLLVLVDNNLFGPDHAAFEERVALLASLRKRKRFDAWGALVTADFFQDEARVRRARDSGCRALFCGIESFEPETLVAYRKRQNVSMPPVDVLRTSLDQGILPIYGLILDVIHRSASDLAAEVSRAVAFGHGILPNFVSAPIPYPGTPFFHECAGAGRLLPAVRVRDLNGSTVCVRPRDDLGTVAALIRDLGALRGLRWQSIRKTAGAWFRRELSPSQLAILSARTVALLLRRSIGTGSRGRTHIGPTEALDDLYRPRCQIAPSLRRHFEPTFLTDADGLPAPAFALGAAPAFSPNPA
jgi:hopanoid C-2 methylase